MILSRRSIDGKHSEAELKVYSKTVCTTVTRCDVYCTVTKVILTGNSMESGHQQELTRFTLQ